ncbi:unnamed protein product [Spirodela intermedia]|uniref:Protein SCAR n=1 Tax=Spirodela intermedia TaxID=51605 RepID=A0A7I8KXV8_SPIIN|nr:unnamed protein product [Spirodela intermedia]
MPLVRFELRNEYGLGDPELFRGGAKREEPKALLEGVAVAGLVGILRQLGDLAEFAAEIFHDLHEQVLLGIQVFKLNVIIFDILTCLILSWTLTKDVVIHLAFSCLTSMTYIFLLFDNAGPGSGACLRRYSDPTYFRRVCSNVEPVKVEKVHKERKTHRSKKKLSRSKDVGVQFVMPSSNRANSIQCASPATDGQSIAAETLSTSDYRIKSELGSRSTSFDSRTRLSFVEPVLDINFSAENEEQDYTLSYGSALKDSHIDVCITTIAVAENAENPDGDDEYYNDYLQAQSASGSLYGAWDVNAEAVKPKPKSRTLVIPVLNVNYPLASEEPVCSSPGKPEEKNVEVSYEVGDDQSGLKFDLEQKIPPSPSITWDEKAEIVRPPSALLSDSAIIPGSDSPSLISESGKKVAESSMPQELDNEEMGNGVTHIEVQHFEEVVSETDNYVDASNTLDSETETDSEIQTKRELMLPPNSCHQEMESTTNSTQDVHNTRSSPLDVENVITCHISVDEDASRESITMVSSQSPVSGQSLRDNSPFDCSVGDDHKNSCINLPEANVFQSANVDLSNHSTDCTLQGLLDSGVRTENQKLEGPQTCDEPVTFWTNGGLLGLEPSKPPDFNVTNVTAGNSLPDTHANNCDPQKSELAPRFHDDGCSVVSQLTVSSRGRKSMSFEDGALDSTTGWHSLSVPSGVFADQAGSFSSLKKIEQYGVRPRRESLEFVPVFSEPVTSKVQETQTGSVQFPGNESLAYSNTQAGSVHQGPLKIGVSSSLTNLTRRLLANGFQRKEDRVDFHTSAPAGEVNMDCNDAQNSFIPGDETKGLVGASLEPNTMENTRYSPTGYSIPPRQKCPEESSPPLEHMKMSFQPMNGLETSKLRLEFPDSHLHESIEELMFPSFQLLPGPTIPFQGSCSESDDDTFCRSCPYSSEDSCSPPSDSNSELWAQDEMSASEYHEIRDDSRLSSSAACISSLLEPDRRKHLSTDQVPNLEKLVGDNGSIAFQPAEFLDLPNLDSVTEQETKADCVSSKPLDFAPSTSSGKPPPPPPLPPVQWRATKPVVFVADTLLSSHENDHSVDGQCTNSISGHQLEGDLPRPPSIVQTGLPEKSIKLGRQKDLNQASNGKEPDEREDYLHQIRTKSFQLRPTTTSKPQFPPKPAANIKVAAILEKAIAIRQGQYDRKFNGIEPKGEASPLIIHPSSFHRSSLWKYQSQRPSLDSPSCRAVPSREAHLPPTATEAHLPVASFAGARRGQLVAGIFLPASTHVPVHRLIRRRRTLRQNARRINGVIKSLGAASLISVK